MLLMLLPSLLLMKDLLSESPVPRAQIYNRNKTETNPQTVTRHSEAPNPEPYPKPLITTLQVYPFQVVYAVFSLAAWSLNTLLLIKEYARALPHSIIIRAFWCLSSIISIIKLHTATRM